MQYIGFFLIFVCAYVIKSGTATTTDFVILGFAIFFALEPYLKYFGVDKK